MQTPTSSSASSSLAGESPRLRRARASGAEHGDSSPASLGAPNTPTSRRLTMTLPRVPKMPNFLSIGSPKKHSQPQQQVEPKDKNEPSRFLGDGVSFKAKLIGILEVGEARGDRMCQEALADLKMAIRAAGEHKQRITINIAIDGLRLRDEKTMDCLYHHPVHKISFIAQDMTDSRAFGYIFGSPDTGHRFFGIKTDKAAGQVVVAMRDLFQVVFELKKKEIELAKQHIEQQQQQQFKYTAGKSLGNLFYPAGNCQSRSAGAEASGSSLNVRASRDELRENGCIGLATKSAQQTSEVIADLLDLEIELNSIQQGINQMEKITPSDPFGPDSAKEAASTFNDPFEDSFSPPVPSTSTTKTSSTSSHPALLPPPPTSTRSELIGTSARQTRLSKRLAGSLDTAPISPPPINSPASSAVAAVTAPLASTETWFDTQSDPLFGDNDLPINLSAGTNSLTTVSTTSSSATVATTTAAPSCKKEQVDSSQFDVFTELDPLGTGKSRPYVDKKDFFQELKNPPKKVLKELAEEPRDGESFPATFESKSPVDVPLATGSKSAISSPPVTQAIATTTLVDPFKDPFGETDPFLEENFSDTIAKFSQDNGDPFDTCFADFTMFGSQNKQGNAANVYHGPLRVSLPPERAGNSLLPPPPTSKRSSPIPSAKPKSPRLSKQMSAVSASSNLVRLPSPKAQSRASRRLAKQTTLEDPRSSSVLHSPPSPLQSLADEERLSSSSLEICEIAPEPPPRPAASKPPPLPPKRQQQAGLSLKPPPRPPYTEQYDYINNHDDADDSQSPPLPVPVRRPKSRGSEIPRPLNQISDTQTFSLPPPPAPSVVREEKRQKGTGAAANLTLRQLTKMNITELATSLNVSPGHLSKMTLQELAGFLASVSTEGSPASTSDKISDQREQYSTLRESVDGEETFKADFDSNFADFASNFSSKQNEDVFQEAPFDKYAVFRELVEQEVDVRDEEESEVVEAVPEETQPVVARSDSAMAEEGRREGEDGEEGEEDEEEEEEFGEAGTGPDKYAALREICSEPPQLEEESDKDDSITEAVADKMEEDFNLLTLSRQQSESPESPVPETSIKRESVSIIESTILEEEVCSDAGNQEDETITESLRKSPAVSLEAKLSPSNRIPTPKIPTPATTPDISVDRVAPPTELALPGHDASDKEESWAKFDNETFGSADSRSHNEDEVSPWSLEGNRDFNSCKPYRESPEGLNQRSRGKYISRREAAWHDDDDEDWDESGYRENGWRDEPRRPRKHSPWGRVPPRRTSPWEDDDEEGDVEEYDDYRPRPRGTSADRRSRRPPSWDDDDPEYDEPRPSRRVVGWGDSRRREYEEKRERSGSRGEYMEQRSRRWEREDEESMSKPRHAASKVYPAGYATWGERGSRKAAQERRSREAGMRRKQFDSHYWHYRDPRPPTADYDDPEGYDPRYKAKKTTAWPKRPSSASDVRKGGPMRRGYQSPGSSHSHDAEQLEESFTDRRFRTQSYDQTRTWANEPQEFNSDQEAEYISDKARDVYEQRSHTLHSRRNQKQKRSSRLSSEDIFSPQQRSPFEDDFSTHSFHASEFSSIDSPSTETNKKQQELICRKDSQLSEPELKPPSSSPMDELQVRERESPRSKASLASNRRHSPFEDDFTPPETRRGSGRVPSSMSSDVSEHRRSPHDEPTHKATTSHAPTRGASLAATDDVFLPTSPNISVESAENLENKIFEPRRNERRGWSEDKTESTCRQFAGMKSRLSVLRADTNPNIKKSESVNIFARDSDPFDDDFFVDQASSNNNFTSTHDRPKNNSDPFGKWSEPFDNFDFKEEK